MYSLNYVGGKVEGLFYNSFLFIILFWKMIQLFLKAIYQNIF